MQRCLLCTDPATPGRAHCSKHDSMGTAATLMSAEGVIVNLPSKSSIPALSTGPVTGLPAGTYEPVSAPEGFGAGFPIGEYIVEKKIGEGGMGEVWSAIQPTIGKRVAVKLLNLKVKNDPIQLARFKREATIVNQVKHRHLVDIFSFGELPDKRPYFIMEYLEGETLTAFCKKRGSLPFQEIELLFGQLCRALQAAHDRGVVHRDLKPDNIFMLAGDDEIFAKILDFGIAKLEEDDGLTKTGTRFGTPTYMSPEQCRESKDVDQRSDVYSLGIILYEILCGRTPFYQKGDPAVRVMIRHQSETAALPSTIAVNRNIPRELDAFILKALAKEAKDRPQSCSEFYSQLKAVLPRNEATVSELPPVPVSVVAPPAKAPTKTPIIAAVVAGAALLGVAAAVALKKPAATPVALQAVAPQLEKPVSTSAPTSIASAAPVSQPAPDVVEPALKVEEKDKKGKKKNGKEEKTAKAEPAKVEPVKVEPTKVEPPKPILKNPDGTMNPFNKPKP